MKSPACCLSMWLSVSIGKPSETHAKLHHNFPGKAKCYNVFFSQNIYVCITAFTELQSISGWPTECIILLPTSHFKMTTLATSMKFAYFRLLLRNSKIVSRKTVIHPRMDIPGIEHRTHSLPLKPTRMFWLCLYLWSVQNKRSVSR